MMTYDDMISFQFFPPNFELRVLVLVLILPNSLGWCCVIYRNSKVFTHKPRLQTTQQHQPKVSF